MSTPARASGSVAAWTGNGTVMSSSPSAATRGAGTPRSAKVMTGAGTSLGRAAPPGRRRLAYGAKHGFFCGQSSQNNGLQDLSGRVVEGATPWEPVRSPSDRRPARLQGDALMHVTQGSVRHLGRRPYSGRAPRPVRRHVLFIFSLYFQRLFALYSGSLTHCHPRVSWCTARTRKDPAASDNSATTRTSWR